MRDLKVAIIGASGECGFLNRWHLGHRVSWCEAISLVVIFIAGYLWRIALAKMLGKLRLKSPYEVRFAIKLAVATFVAKNLGDQKSSLFSEKIHLLEPFFAKVTVRNFSQPLIGVYNIEKFPVWNEITQNKYDLICINIGGNDVLQCVDDRTFERRFESLMEVLRRGNPEARIVCYGVHNLGDSLFTEEHIAEVALVTPWGHEVSIKKFLALMGIKRMIQRAAKKSGITTPGGMAARTTADVQAKNDIMRAAVGRHYPSTSVFLTNWSPLSAYERRDYSMDGFHPGRIGLKKAAAKNFWTFLTFARKEIIGEAEAREAGLPEWKELQETGVADMPQCLGLPETDVASSLSI